MRVAALTQGRRQPSSRFRVRQHIGALADLGVGVTEYCPALDAYAGIHPALAVLPRFARAPAVGSLQLYKLAARVPSIYRAYAAELTWLHRELLPGYFTLEGFLPRDFVFDVDDAIWLSNSKAPRRVSAIASRASAVIAGNDFLADWFSNHNKTVQVVPTAVDADKYSPLTGDDASGPFTIGWIGTKGNLEYVRAIAPALSAFLGRFIDASLLIISDARPKLDGISADRVQFVPWSERTEVQSIQRMTVGIMPLPNIDWARGKCSFKMLQYMACGKPVVVSPVGMNQDVLSRGDIGLAASTRDEWVDALTHLYMDRDVGVEMGQQGRRVVLTEFSVGRVSESLSKIFKAGLAARQTIRG